MPSQKLQDVIELTFPASLVADAPASPVAIQEDVLALFDECGPGVRRYVASFNLGRPATEDVVQDVFLALFRHLSLGRPTTNLKGWLFQVAHNLALRGETDVVVLEKGYLLAGASGRNGGGVRMQWGTPTNVQLAKRSIELMKGFARELAKLGRVGGDLRRDGGGAVDERVGIEGSLAPPIDAEVEMRRCGSRVARVADESEGVTDLDVLAGRTLDRLAAAEHTAESGEIVVDTQTAELLGDAVLLAGWRADEHGNRQAALIASLAQPIAPSPWPALPTKLGTAQIRPWLAPAVAARLGAPLPAPVPA